MFELPEIIVRSKHEVQEDVSILFFPYFSLSFFFYSLRFLTFSLEYEDAETERYRNGEHCKSDVVYKRKEEGEQEERKA